MKSNAATSSLVSEYAKPSDLRGSWEAGFTMILYLAAVYLVSAAYLQSNWPLFSFSVVFAGLVNLRVFILHHDCGHGAMFKNSMANKIVGTFFGFLVLTPFHYWAERHAIHHGSSGDLDRRDVGDITVLTVDEYYNSSPMDKFLYRLVRNPLILLLIGGMYEFVVQMRYLRTTPDSDKRLRKTSVKLSIHLTTLALLLVGGSLVYFIGVKAVLLIVVLPLWIAATCGVTLFYAQHTFEETYYRHTPDWNYKDAVMQGSSYLKLPWPLDFFSAKIGYHHIHHLNLRVPFYNLPKCYEEVPEMREGVVLGLRDLPRILGLKLYSEKLNRMVTYRQAASLWSEETRAEIGELAS